MKRICLLALTLAVVAACANGPLATPRQASPAFFPPAPTSIATSTPAVQTVPPLFSAAPSASSIPIASALASGSSASPLPVLHTPLPPGRYTKTGFVPTIEFTVGDGWSGQQVAQGYFDIEQNPTSPDVIAVQFANLNGASLGALIDQATSQPNTKVIDQGEITIDGRPGVYATVETTDPADTHPPVFRPVLSTAAGPLSIASGRRLQINLVEVSSGFLAVLIGGSMAKWDETLAQAQPVVDSVTIAD